jgi:hypothetical protein
VKKAWERQEIENENEAEALEGLQQFFLEKSEAQGKLPFLQFYWCKSPYSYMQNGRRFQKKHLCAFVCINTHI